MNATSQSNTTSVKSFLNDTTRSNTTFKQFLQIADACVLKASDPSDYWYEQITHNGISPFIEKGDKWKVFRNVVSDYSADPRGAIDAHDAFQRAIDGDTDS